MIKCAVSLCFFVRYHPTAEDIETYKKFKDRQAELENTDQFMLQLCEIPYLKTRLDVLMVINELPVQYEDLAPVGIIYGELHTCHLFGQSPISITVTELAISMHYFTSGQLEMVPC